MQNILLNFIVIFLCFCCNITFIFYLGYGHIFYMGIAYIHHVDNTVPGQCGLVPDSAYEGNFPPSISLHRLSRLCFISTYVRGYACSSQSCSQLGCILGQPELEGSEWNMHEWNNFGLGGGIGVLSGRMVQCAWCYYCEWWGTCASVCMSINGMNEGYRCMGNVLCKVSSFY